MQGTSATQHSIHSASNHCPQTTHTGHTQRSQSHPTSRPKHGRNTPASQSQKTSGAGKQTNHFYTSWIAAPATNHGCFILPNKLRRRRAKRSGGSPQLQFKRPNHAPLARLLHQANDHGTRHIIPPHHGCHRLIECWPLVQLRVQDQKHLPLLQTPQTRQHP